MRYFNKVMEADNQKAECGREHHRRAMLFHEAEKKLLQLEEKHRRSIIKARPYFEIKAQCDQMLATQKERVEYLERTVKETKRNYATSLRTLEGISNEIHQQRRDYGNQKYVSTIREKNTIYIFFFLFHAYLTLVFQIFWLTDRENLALALNSLARIRIRSAKMSLAVPIKYPPLGITRAETTRNCTISKLVKYM